MYVLQEIQTNGNQTALLPAQTYAERKQAEGAYHAALAAAAVSNVTIHAVVLLDEHGNTVRQEWYEHGAEEAE